MASSSFAHCLLAARVLLGGAARALLGGAAQRRALTTSLSNSGGVGGGGGGGAARVLFGSGVQPRALTTSPSSGGGGGGGGVRAMRARPLCYADPAAKTIDVGAGPFSPPASFFAEVADGKAVADAHKYANNVERYVGTVKVPVGLIGPLRVSMDDDPHPNRVELIDKVYHVPMATTCVTERPPRTRPRRRACLRTPSSRTRRSAHLRSEGVLLASYNRGAKVRAARARARVRVRTNAREPACSP